MTDCIFEAARKFGARARAPTPAPRPFAGDVRSKPANRDESEIDLSDLGGIGLSNYALWDYVTVRLTKDEYNRDQAKRYHLSHVRREWERCALEYEKELKAPPDSPESPGMAPPELDWSMVQRWRLMDATRDLEVWQVLMRSSPLANAIPSNAGSRALIEAANVRKKFQFPDVWFTPFALHPAVAPEISHLLPFPAPYQHIIVCWDSLRNEFVIFDSEARRDVGAYIAVAAEAPIDSTPAKMMWFDVRYGCYADRNDYLLVTCIRDRFALYYIRREKSDGAPSVSAASSDSAASAAASSGSASAAAGATNDQVRFSFELMASYDPCAKVSAMCCTTNIDDLSTPRLICLFEGGSLNGYGLGQFTSNSGQLVLNRVFGPITHRRYGARSKRNPLATTMCALPGGRVATAGGDTHELGVIRIWHLDEPISSEGVAVVSELRIAEHKGRLIVDLQLSSIN